MRRILDLASGHWPDILQSLGGITPDQLTNKHQPCPNCGGTDRYRWDDDEGDGGWFCNQCGGKDQMGGGGNGMDLLMRVTGWDFKQALSRVEQHLGLPPEQKPATSRKPRRPARIPDRPPADTPAPDLGRAVGQWCYRNADGHQLFWVQRIDNGDTKLFVQRTWLDNRWHFPSRRDPFTSEWPAPRPLYRLHDLAASNDMPVLIAEGEKAADAGATLLTSHVSIGWCGGTAGISHTDWSPLAGRTVILWPDNDDPGRKCMAKLGPRLQQLGCTVSVFVPPAGCPEKWDLADALAAGAGKDPAAVSRQVAKLLADNIRQLDPLPEPKPEPEPEPQAPSNTVVDDVPNSAPFECLGFDGDNYYYQPGNTGQVIRITGPGHSTNNLLRLASLAYWETIYPSKTGVNWNSAVSSLLARQANAGVYSPDRIRGRGAWSDAGRAILHLGDRLIVDGISHSVMKPPPSRFNYQRLASIEIPIDVPPLTDQQGAEILDIAGRFHWEVPASGILLAGWLALAPICGALSWRPHIWLTASAGSGKSAILDRFLGPLLESLALWPEGNTTEAFIRQELRADALPVIFDEAESNEQADRKRIQDILALARVASSSGRGVIGKGGADGAAQRFTIRSMFLMCSISTALKQGADRSRFAQLTLRNPNYLPKDERIAHWTALDRDLTNIITTDLGHQLLHRSVRSIEIIRNSVAAFRRAAADRFDSQREGDQYGTLLAGAWSLMNARVATEADAYALIDDNNWEPYKESNAEPDEQRCLQQILQHQMRVEADRVDVVAGRVVNKTTTITRTVWELIEAVRGNTEASDLPPESAEAHLGRIGLRVQDERLLVANNALGLQRILADTPWAHSWPTVLSRLPGACKAGKVRFRGMNESSRAVSLPIVTD
jgi:putative DNA primase/helicase